MKRIYPLFFMLFLTSLVFAQQEKDTLTINETFDKIYRISTSYQEYKVISKARYLNLKKLVLDSVKSLETTVKNKNTRIKNQKDSIQSLQNINATYKNDLATTEQEKNSINLLGLSMAKSTYNIIMWLLVIVFASLTSYFMFLFKKSNYDTKKAKSDLYDIEEEFAVHKKKSLDREQKLRRKLQDEINKQRGI